MLLPDEIRGAIGPYMPYLLDFWSGDRGPVNAGGSWEGMVNGTSATLNGAGCVVNNAEQLGAVNRGLCNGNAGNQYYAEVADNDLYSFGAGSTAIPITVVAWGYCQGFVSPQGLVNKLGSTNQFEWSLLCISSGVLQGTCFDLTSGNRIAKRVSGTKYTGNAWYQIALTYNGSKSWTGINLWVDETKATSATNQSAGSYGGMNNLNQPVRFGVYEPGVFPAVGWLDNIMVFRGVELPDENIIALYHAQRHLFGV